MRANDLIQFGIRSISGTPQRTLLMLLAMAIGVGSVMVLTALGEGARRYVTGEFSQLGTNLLIVLPGRSETTGGAPPIMGETPRDLTLDDALPASGLKSTRFSLCVRLTVPPHDAEHRHRPPIQWPQSSQCTLQADGALWPL